MHLFISLVMFCTSTLFTPGPNNLMIMTSGLNFGIRKSLPHYFGITLGFPIMLLIIGLGLSAFLIKFPVIQEVIKYLGIAYILYLAYKIASAQPKSASTTSAAHKPLSFIQAALFQWTNPKALVMAIGAYSAYSALSNSVAFETAIVTSTFLILGFLSAGLWLSFGIGLQRFLKNPKSMRGFNLVMALLLVVSCVLILVEPS